MKTLAIIGFLLLVILIAWATVKAVNLVPKAFSSLASIAESLDNYRERASNSDDELSISKDEDEITSGNPLVIGWTKEDTDGTYEFTYDCIDGVRVDIVDDEGLRAIDCDTSYDLGNTDTVTIVAETDKTESVTLTYTVVFTPASEGAEASSSDAVAILPGEGTEPGTPAEDDSDDVAEVPNNTEPTSAPAPAPHPAPAPAPRPQPTQTYTYAIPVSDPNGRIDLGASYIAVGELNGRTFRAGTIERDEDGAFQFEVKNFGTKTSERWSYTVSLPDGETYTSESQAALKPNERAVITLGFPVGNDASHTFTVRVRTDNDRNSGNNSFNKTISFSR